eukprot:jgi/Psemu1/35416/gm1.35416_g
MESARNWQPNSSTIPNWHLAMKVQMAPQEPVKHINPGYGWKIQPPTPPKIEEADLIKTLDWSGIFTVHHKLPPKYKDDNYFHQDWFLGICKQLISHHCPEWADEKPICAMSFAATMEFPIFAGDIEDMEEPTLSAFNTSEIPQRWYLFWHYCGL